jgi:hypothetical protein
MGYCRKANQDGGGPKRLTHENLPFQLFVSSRYCRPAARLTAATEATTFKRENSIQRSNDDVEGAGQFA